MVVRRASNERGALAIIYIIGAANLLFDARGRWHRYSTDLTVAELTEFFGAPKSGHTSRAETMLKAIGRPRDDGPIALGTPDLLVADARAYLSGLRDRNL